MAVLGFQLVTTLIGACILSKIVTYFSCTRFVFDGLSRFMAPSDQLLIEASGSFKTRNKNKKRRVDATNGPNSNTSSQDRFHFPRALPIQLQSSVITHADVAILPLYSSFQWLLDFTVCTLGIYLVTELANSSLLSSHSSASSNWSVIPPPRSSTSNAFSLSTRLNLSLVWLALVVWFTLRVLVSMTSIYFRTHTPELHKAESRSSTSSTAPGANSGEWFLVVVTGFCFLILTGFFMALDGRYFEFELQPAYTNLTMNTTVSPAVPLISWGAFNVILAFTCASIGALFVYPGMKFGRTYLDAVSKGQTSAYQRLLFHLTFIMPLFSLLLWVKPITDHLLRSLTTLSFSHTVMQQPTLLALITVSVELLGTQIGTLRLLSCLFVVLLRISVTRWNLQVYLNSAQDKLDRFNREPGQTSNKEVQRLVASIFYCLNLVALQWIAPTVLLLSLVCLYKNTAGLCWLPFGAQPSPSSTISPNSTLEQSRDFVGSSDTYSWTATLSEARLTFNQLVACFSTRGVAISRGVFGFLVWWCLFALQSVSLLGLAYHRFTSDH
ncbi:hypothetical protein CRM22_003484 [Opisthorchis felineus]|uniref:Transmembrane protein 161B n=1 Tax=Opisthorchis felineus TaxID=147828 RepID=A0A4V3SFV2_OPIFE|nr:hypothetical protein CRM22_003484 [Opisthorchis felineus]